MRNVLRLSLVTVAAIVVASCGDSMTGTRSGPRIRASLSIAPEFDARAKEAAHSLTQIGLDYDRVRVVVVRPATDTLKDTTITFHSTDAPRTLELAVLAVVDEQLLTTVQYRTATTVLFEGSGTVTATAATASSSVGSAVSITVKYTGPAATATKLTLAPGAGTYASGAVTQFSAKAFDANNVELANPPVAWSVSDTSVATIDVVTGALTPKVQRGSVAVTATLATISATVSVNVVPVASRLRVVQGAAQTGAPGTQLTLPVIIEAVAADGLPGVGTGLTATFAPPASGGSVNPTTVALGADGRAQSVFTLGPTAGGIFLYTATVGTFSVTIPEIAVVGAPTQFITNGPTTFTMTAGVPPNPLPTFRVADAVGNSVPNVALQATIANTQGSTGPIPFIADTIGIGDPTKIAPTRAGTYTVTITSGNSAVTLPTLTYTITVLAAAASKLAFDQQPTTAQADSVIKPAIRVLIQDSFGNTVTSSSAPISLVLDPTTTSGEQILSASNAINNVPAVAGIATFSDIRMKPAKLGVRIIATSPGLTQILSLPFDIKP